MTEERAKRKLSAIFSADVKGYSRLMQDDESSTIQTLKTYRELMASLIQGYHGRVVDSPGDNVLSEFGSVVDAVECAVNIQQQLKEKNAPLPENRRMEFRIGVNLGDVVEDEDRIYGDGVNIAARVEGLAEGGGICISGTAYDQIGKKLSLGYEYLGEQTVKNIEKPIRVYRLLMEPEDAGKLIGEEKPKPKSWVWALAAAVVVLIVGGVTIWQLYFRLPSVEPASVEKMAFPLPDKPSIAVLPFDNMSGDPGEDYFSDGITEEIITGLAKVPRLFVIARNSTFTYKGKPVKVQQVAEDLGVKYVLEGSVRKAKDRVRITAQLIDALTGKHLWAEKYDRDLKDIFALQDEIMMKIVAAMQVKLTDGEQALIAAGGTNNFEAYVKFLKGLEYSTRFNKDGNLLARKMAQEAIALDPNYPRGYRLLAATHWLEVILGISKSRKQSFAKAAKLYQKVIAMDPSEATAHALLGIMYTRMGQHEKGIAEAEKGVALNPNAADALSFFGLNLHYNGRHKEAIEAIKKAIRLNPFPKDWYFINLGIAYFHAGRYEEAIEVLKKALRNKTDNLLAHIYLASTYSLSGYEQEARGEAAEVLRLNPKFSLSQYQKGKSYKNPHDKALLIDALRKAGIPETPPLPLPDKPSIAVLPFTNMSDDPKQEYFSDGITNDIITDLSKFGGMFVVASNSTFTYKNKPTKVQEVSRDLGVRYVLEGGVQKSGNRVRINAQLIDATTGQHLWAERFDRSMDDIFAVQDEITEKIVAAVFVKVDLAVRHRAMRKPTESVEAYDLLLRAREIWHRWGKENNDEALRLQEKAIELDPEYALAYADVAWSLVHDYLYYGGSEESLERAVETAQKAVSLDHEDYRNHWTLGYVFLHKRLYDQAMPAYEKALALNPNDADLIALFADALTHVGRPQDAIEQMKQAIRLNPLSSNMYAWNLGLSYYHAGQYEEAILTLKPLLHLGWYSVSLRLTASYVQLGRLDEARAQAAEVLKIKPDFSIATFTKTQSYKNSTDLEHYVDDLRNAGLK